MRIKSAIASRRILQPELRTSVFRRFAPTTIRFLTSAWCRRSLLRSRRAARYRVAIAFGMLRGKAPSKGFKQSRRTLKPDLPREECPEDAALLVDELKPGAAVGSDV